MRWRKSEEEQEGRKTDRMKNETGGRVRKKERAEREGRKSEEE